MEETVVAKRPREEEPQQVLKEEDVIIDSVESSSSKRHKPYNHILSLLESEELLEDSTQEDLSPLITTLKHELVTCPSESDDDSHHLHIHTLLSPSQNNNGQHNNLTTTTTTSTLEDCSSTSTTLATTTTHSSNVVLEEDDKERVMRHLLEASDDELGIPNRSGEVEGSASVEGFGEDGFGGNIGDMFSSICDVDGLLWELEDETANYYALLQSELFL